ncbi:MAG: N-acetylneuraminate synthase [Thiomonas sp.]|uniref:N-acetylneuraminate synthase n=1 Tax=Thiomonas sp. TaxID=2047785 RepID=UPI002A35DD6D|nr:N-acetylneuraminate synthase [Thiomonas sp.]MDY0329835.1 N-acetylneuraminate synthase [Thiomonas sp.]
MPSDRVFLIAEAGVNHNGQLDLALELVDAAKASGADAVKFQTFRAEDLALPGAATAAYQQGATGETDQFAMLRKLELSAEQHQIIAAHCARVGIEFMSTPFSEAAVDLLVGLGVRRLKISSGEIVNRPLLAKAAATGLPLILSTGMATLDEVKQAVGWVQAAWGQEQSLTLLQCTSAYPAPDDALNLRAIATLRTETGLPTGYSDHSLGNTAALAAVALGACVIEKHLTLDRNLPGPDHRASSEPAEFAALAQDIRRIEAMLGDGIKAPRPDEIDVRAVARRSVVLATALPAGTVLRREHLQLRRPASGIPAAELDAVIGQRLRADAAAGAVLQWENLQGGDSA